MRLYKYCTNVLSSDLVRGAESQNSIQIRIQDTRPLQTLTIYEEEWKSSSSATSVQEEPGEPPDPGPSDQLGAGHRRLPDHQLPLAQRQGAGGCRFVLGRGVW